MRSTNHRERSKKESRSLAFYLESDVKLAVMTADSNLFNLISLCLSDETFQCFRFDDDVALSRATRREEYAAIVVDAATGMDATRSVFARRACYGDRRTPLIVIGSFDSRDGIEHAFSLGADDVVRSPVDRNELAVRIHLALRRVRSAAQPRSDDDAIECGPYRLDRRAGLVQVHGREIRLTTREFAVAWLLFSYAGEYVSRQTMAGAVWGCTEDIIGRTLEQHIYKLRKKLDLGGPTGVQLRTMYAHGYRIDVDDDHATGIEPGIGLAPRRELASTSHCTMAPDCQPVLQY